jgi:hypothetical protein
MADQQGLKSWTKEIARSICAGRKASGGGIALTAALVVATGSMVAVQMVLPPAATAYTSRSTLFLTREPTESFEVFVQRAEIIARAAVQRSFDADILVTDVAITVVGENQGISMPILTVDVSRNDWQLRPDVEYWATYFSASEALMEMSE